jgi:hypothetical protein
MVSFYFNTAEILQGFEGAVRWFLLIRHCSRAKGYFTDCGAIVRD